MKNLRGKALQAVLLKNPSPKTSLGADPLKALVRDLAQQSDMATFG